ncbi:hypothetical protein AYK26_06500 [Euryarchaeota archaeon SM23-78]|nr:MAG: hypothetical protein AYK26_06500 [Euryarchaeota archaeon SM23-78]MBW3000596.1 hypothetical protein [Candidatus Woesearchaeota archaeon]
MKLNFLKYISPGYYAMKGSQEGLDYIKEFETKVSDVKNKEEIETLIQEYEKKIDSIPKNTAPFWLSIVTPLLPAFAIPNGNIAIFYIVGVGSVQLWEWTIRVRNFKAENDLWPDRWTSVYPYKKKFEEKAKQLLEEYL